MGNAGNDGGCPPVSGASLLTSISTSPPPGPGPTAGPSDGGPVPTTTAAAAAVAGGTTACAPRVERVTSVGNGTAAAAATGRPRARPSAPAGATAPKPAGGTRVPAVAVDVVKGGACASCASALTRAPGGERPSPPLAVATGGVVPPASGAVLAAAESVRPFTRTRPQAPPANAGVTPTAAGIGLAACGAAAAGKRSPPAGRASTLTLLQGRSGSSWAVVAAPGGCAAPPPVAAIAALGTAPAEGTPPSSSVLSSSTMTGAEEGPDDTSATGAGGRSLAFADGMGALGNDKPRAAVSHSGSSGIIGVRLAAACIADSCASVTPVGST